MKIKFDYNNVEPDVVAETLKYFYDRYKTDDIEFGALTVYATIRDNTNNHPLGFFRDGKEIELLIKNKPFKRTSKKQLATINDDNGEIMAYIYES